jgi:alanine racemase
MTDYHPPLRLRLSGSALTANWSWLAQRSGSAACGAAIKADGYGLGAVEVARRLRAVGCRDFFVATWAEALALADAGQGNGVSVLHGVREEDLAIALALPMVRPVLNTAGQVARWKAASPGRSCDLMVDTGMSRLGLSTEELLSDLTQGLNIDTVMSHLASADDKASQLNLLQLQRFEAIAASVPARRYSLANSAGICLGSEYHFDLTRPGLALYGGMPTVDAALGIGQVVFPETQILQRRMVRAGQSVGYNATWTASADTSVVIANLGYADGYLRGFSGMGKAKFGDWQLPVIGRVSMDLIAFAVPSHCPAGEGDWLTIEYDLAVASRQSGLSPYELLTGLGDRFARDWF